jgi:PPE-repeat protein
MVFADFAAQPPEVISGLIYSGAGAGPLLAAAAAWEGLAGQLHSTASSYGAAISELTGSWQGPSSESMAAAAFPYVTWLATTAGQAEEAATQAQAAASAYEAAFAAIVPPAVIAANRSELASLVASNIFGQNNSAIETVEAEYGEIWAQDVATMLGYASSSAAATKLTSFTAAPQTTSGSAASASAVTAAASSNSTITQLESILQQLTTGINTLTSDYTTFWEKLITQVTGNSQIASTWEALYSMTSAVGSQATWTNVVNSTTSLGISQWKNFFVYQPWSAAMTKSSLAGGLGSSGVGVPASLARPTSAILGGANTVGKLSVPPSWAGATPAIRLASTVLPGTGMAAASAADFADSLLSGATAGSFAGGALGTPAARVVSSTRAQVRPSTGKRKAPVKLDRVIAQLQEQPDVVQHWSVDEAGLDDLVAELSTKPGVHAVHVCADGETPVAAPQSQLG